MAMEEPRRPLPVLPQTRPTRAEHFLKRFNVRAKVGIKKAKDDLSLVTNSSHRNGRSLDIITKSNMSHSVIRLQLDDHPSRNDRDSSSNSASCSNSFSRSRSGQSDTTQHSQMQVSPSPRFSAALQVSTPPSPLEPPICTTDMPVSIALEDRLVQSSSHDTIHANQPDVEQTPRLSNVMPPAYSFHPSDHSQQTPTLSQLVAVERSLRTSANGDIQSRRLPAVQLSTTLPPPFRVNPACGLRLSPSFVSHPPLPFRHLPTLPPPTPVAPEPSRPQVRLRHMPELSVHGRSDADHEADHENSGLGDSDDEDDLGDITDEMEGTGRDVAAAGAGQSDDEDEDALSDASPEHVVSHNGATGGSTNLASVGTSRLSLSFFDGTLRAGSRSATARASRERDATPTEFNTRDYFSSKQPTSRDSGSPNYTPRPGDLSKSPAPERRSKFSIPRIIRLPSAEKARPGLYSAGSRSMIDLSQMTQRDKSLPSVPEAVDSMKGKSKSQHPDAPSTSAQAGSTIRSDVAVAGHTLRRQTSMPSFNPNSAPPPYPDLFAHPMSRNHVVQPRDEEGRERLPPYSNSVYLLAVMPRKMEFSEPGLQAKDRKWRRVLCELEGTVFRVYKCPRGAVGVNVFSDWWEKKVGVGDIAANNPNPRQLRSSKTKDSDRPPGKLNMDFPSSSYSSGSASEAERQQSDESLAQSQQSSRQRRTLGSNFLLPSKANGSRSQSRRRSGSSPTSEQSRRSSFSNDRSSSRTDANSSTSEFSTRDTSSASSAPLSSFRSHFIPSSRSSLPRVNEAPRPNPADLIRAYSLQHAESGLGNDYLKRKNVVRVRMEGEQFLLQAPDVPAVVEWIEGFHAATNIALDLDERPMPKGPMFPRRRRRRGRRTETDGDGSRQEPSTQSERD